MPSPESYGVVTKEGLLVKKGLTTFYRPWATRIFRLYAEDATLSYSTPNGVLKGRVKIEKCKAQTFIVPVAEKKPYTFQVMVRKFSNNSPSSDLSPYPQGYDNLM